MSENRNLYNLRNLYTSILQTTPLRFGHQFTVQFNGRDLERYAGPGLNNQQEPRNNITYYVRSAEIPRVDINSAKVNYFAAGFEVPGTIQYPEQWQVAILLDQNMTQYNILRNWQEEMSSYRLSTGGIKTIPNITASVNLLDRTFQFVVKEYVMEGVWISDVEDISMKYQEGASEAMTCNCTFEFQYFYEKELEDDPLGAIVVRR